MSDAQDPRHASDRRAPKVQDLVERVQPTPAKLPQTINSPEHYTRFKDDPYEVWRVLRAWGLEEDALLWTAGKYLGRAGKKAGSDILDDLRKMVWYVNKRIEAIEEERASK